MFIFPPKCSEKWIAEHIFLQKMWVMCPDRFFYFFGFSTTPPQKIWSSVLQPSETPFFGLNFQKTAPGGGGRCVYLMDSPKGTMPASGVTAQLTHFDVPVHFVSVFPAHGADSNSWKLHRGLHSENKKAKYCLSAEHITVTQTNAQQPLLGAFSLKATPTSFCFSWEQAIFYTNQTISSDSTYFCRQRVEYGCTGTLQRNLSGIFHRTL